MCSEKDVKREVANSDCEWSRDDSDALDTDTKLAILCSLHPETAQSILLDLLVENNGSVARVSKLLTKDEFFNGNNAAATVEKGLWGKTQGLLTAQQGSPSGELSRSRNRTAEGISDRPFVSGRHGVQVSLTRYMNKDSKKRKRAWTDEDAKSLDDLELGRCQFDTGDDSKKSNESFFGKPAGDALMGIRNKVIHLYTPREIHTRTPCTFHPFFLPSTVADQILREMLADSQSWKANQFRLFNREVTSSHTTCFYVSPKYMDEFKGFYFYNGSIVEDIRPFSDTMLQVQKIIEAVVNREINERGFLPFQYRGFWAADVAFCNRYNGPSEGVGYHSDRLTNIGPMPVIATLSLGVTREFRLREITPNAQTHSLHLPHNSLLVMHPPCQEKFKHTIISVSKLDTHPISDVSRISVVFRMYRDCYAPKKTPRCKCGVGMILRCVSRRLESKGRYFWSCSAAYQQEKGCDRFIWAEMDSEGVPLEKNAKNKTDDRMNASSNYSKDKLKDDLSNDDDYLAQVSGYDVLEESSDSRW
ncbi:hypothetical protein V1511DRAFT_501157 [Dipodascopsis uninucleata]